MGGRLGEEGGLSSILPLLWLFAGMNTEYEIARRTNPSVANPSVVTTYVVTTTMMVCGGAMLVGVVDLGLRPVHALQSLDSVCFSCPVSKAVSPKP